MKQFSFYQVLGELLEKTICQLSEKSYHGNHKVTILAPDLETQELINKILWTYSQKQFIPHGSKSDPTPEKQPVYITTEIENPNNATILIIVNPDTGKLNIFEKLLAENSSQLSFNKFERCIMIFTLLNEATTPDISNFQQYLTNNNLNFKFFKQTLNGSWIKEK